MNDLYEVLISQRQAKNKLSIVTEYTNRQLSLNNVHLSCIEVVEKETYG